MSLRRRRATPAEGPKRPRFLFWEVSPLTRRRIDQFRQNRRGFWSLMIFVGIFAGTWLAEGFANDKPLLIELGGSATTRFWNATANATSAASFRPSPTTASATSPS